MTLCKGFLKIEIDTVILTPTPGLKHGRENKKSGT